MKLVFLLDCFVLYVGVYLVVSFAIYYWSTEFWIRVVGFKLALLILCYAYV